MPNVPSASGQIRARATCTKFGKTVAGQSEYFRVPVNGTVEVSMKFGNLYPVPTTLTITTPKPQLTSAVETT